MFVNWAREFYQRLFQYWSEVWTVKKVMRGRESALDSVKLSPRPAKNR